MLAEKPHTKIYFRRRPKVLEMTGISFENRWVTVKTQARQRKAFTLEFLREHKERLNMC